MDRGEEGERHDEIDRGEEGERHDEIDRGEEGERHDEIDRGEEGERHDEIDRGEEGERKKTIINTCTSIYNSIVLLSLSLSMDNRPPLIGMLLIRKYITYRLRTIHVSLHASLHV